MKIMRVLSRVVDHVLKFMLIVSSGLVVITVILVNLGIATRTFANTPIPWIPEISGYIILYITFLAAAWILREEGHVKMDFLLSHLSFRNQPRVNKITSSVSAVVCAVLTFYGAKVTWDLFRTDYFTPSILELPKFIFTIPIAIGSFLLLIQFIRRASHNPTNHKETNPTRE